MDYLLYITREGDRWDFIAWEFYGDAFRYEPIRRVNPDAPRTSSLPAGLQLMIPILEEPVDAGLPLTPWRD